jgi:hypothetical protein
MPARPHSNSNGSRARAATRPVTEGFRSTRGAFLCFDACDRPFEPIGLPPIILPRHNGNSLQFLT